MNETRPIITHCTQRRIWSMHTLWILTGLFVLHLPLESTAQTENQLTSLYNTCATSALDGSLGQILDISFDITPQANTSLIDGKSDGDVEYSACHVRVLHDGIIQTLNFVIVSTGNGIELVSQSPYSDSANPSSHVTTTGKTTQTTSADSIVITGEPLSREIVSAQPSLSPFADETESVTPVETATTETKASLTNTATSPPNLEKLRTFYFSE